jgi:hypothetical protein
MISVAALHRHPVKGLSPEVIEAAELAVGAHFPGDRLFAFENGPSGFDPADPQHQPKIKFLMLMRNEALAALATHFCEKTGVLTVGNSGVALASGDVRTPEGRCALEAFFTAYMGTALRGPVKLLDAPEGFRFMDSKQGFVSLLNLATVKAIGDALGVETLDARRFRGNIHLEGLAAFAENDLVGRTLRIGAVELEVTKRIERCAATDVNPATALRDTTMVASLEQLYGHHDCGIYARIKKAGTIRPGLDVEIV